MGGNCHTYVYGSAYLAKHAASKIPLDVLCTPPQVSMKLMIAGALCQFFCFETRHSGYPLEWTQYCVNMHDPMVNEPLLTSLLSVCFCALIYLGELYWPTKTGKGKGPPPFIKLFSIFQVKKDCALSSGVVPLARNHNNWNGVQD